jgi:hypothetical protein
MRLALIEPEPLGQAKLVFDCTWCRHGEVVVLDLNSASLHANGCSSPKQATCWTGHRPRAGKAWMREHYRRLGQALRF